MKKEKTPKDPLVGQYFHEINSQGLLGWQGKIVSSPIPGFYLIAVFDWLVGGHSFNKLIKAENMTTWYFYDTAEEMQHSFEHGACRKGGQHWKNPVITERPEA